MSKITKENCLLISNSELLALVRREERGAVIYIAKEANMEEIEKTLIHLIGGRNETPKDSL